MKAAAHDEAKRLQQSLVEAEDRTTDLEAKLQEEQDARKSQVTCAIAKSASTANPTCDSGWVRRPQSLAVLIAGCALILQLRGNVSHVQVAELENLKDAHETELSTLKSQLVNLQ